MSSVLGYIMDIRKWAAALELREQGDLQGPYPSWSGGSTILLTLKFSSSPEPHQELIFQHQ